MSTVLIAENELFAADLLRQILVDDGYEVCGIARGVEPAVTLGKRHKPDLALLDLRLASGELGTEIAAALGRGSGPGILYVTSDVGQIKLTKADGEACLSKPCRPADLLRSLKIVAEIVATGKASRPFPSGFRLLEARLPGAAF
jgi:CheY-like chemotaxis protein